MEHKRRGKRTNIEQMATIINYLEVNRILITGKTNPNSVNDVETHWDNLVAMLNEIPNGSRKDKKQWKNFLTEWKSKTRKKARLLKKDQTMTGGGPSTVDDLSDMENRLMKVVGWITVTGCDDLPPEVTPDTEIYDHSYIAVEDEPQECETVMEIVDDSDINISLDEDNCLQQPQPVGEIVHYEEGIFSTNFLNKTSISNQGTVF